MAYEYPLQSDLDVSTALDYLRGAGIACEWSGTCIWVTSDHMDDRQKVMVMDAGGRYAQRRKQWYIRAVDGLARRVEVAA